MAEPLAWVKGGVSEVWRWRGEGRLHPGTYCRLQRGTANHRSLAACDRRLPSLNTEFQNHVLLVHHPSSKDQTLLISRRRPSESLNWRTILPICLLVTECG